MPNAGFFDLDDRYAKLDGIGERLVKIKEVVDWESFPPILKPTPTQAKPRKNNAGRKAFDAVLMLKVLVLQHITSITSLVTRRSNRPADRSAGRAARPVAAAGNG